jgi:hypothetical protein
MTHQFPPAGLPVPEPRKKRRWVWWLGGVFGVLMFLVVLGTIVGPPPDRTSANAPLTTTTAAPAPASSLPTTTPGVPITTTTTTSITTATTAVSTTEVPAPPPAPVAKTCTVPNVVGLVHQTAQDTMQAAGLFMLMEQDATGQGRMLVVDRNWRTTAQSVAAGSVVDCSTEILLSAKKLDE